MSAPLQHYRQTFERMQDNLAGAGVPWVARLRGAAMSTFERQGFPDKRVEAWKYTDLRALDRRVFTPLPAADLFDTALRPWLFDGEPMHRLVFVDGRFAPQLCPLRPLLTGVTLANLAAALEHEPHQVRAALEQVPAAERMGFDAMNTAFLQDGAWLRLEPGVTVEQPIHLLFVNTGRAGELTSVRNLIQAGPGSSARIIESWVALNDAEGLTNTLTEIQLEDHARIEHYTLEEEGDATTHIGGLYVRQAAASRLAAHSISLGGRLVRNDLQVDLDGEGAECALNGFSFTRGHQHVDNFTRIEHRRPRTSAGEWYRGILDDRSRSVFTGYIKVHPDAQQTQAQQSNHSLLLSRRAEADARPQFEIHADDVQCAHGCTVGELDADALFYLRSRALDETGARNLLIRAFAADVLERMTFEPVRRRVETQLAARLERHEAAQGMQA